MEFIDRVINSMIPRYWEWIAHVHEMTGIYLKYLKLYHFASEEVVNNERNGQKNMCVTVYLIIVTVRYLSKQRNPAQGSRWHIGFITNKT